MNAVQRRAQQAGISLDSLPVHVAIIMDGNGRYATSKGFMRLWGHREGYKTLKKILLLSAELGIGHLTVYGFSAENWRRPEQEVSGLMSLIEEAARRELRDLVSNNVRARVIGRRHELPASLQEAFDELESSTRDNTGIVFTLAINYGGRAEIVDAARRLLAAGADPNALDEETFHQNLYDPSVPDPDLMVRTAGELRVSNFMIWQAAYAELHVTDVTWPEFGEAELFEAVRHFQKRVRKFGGLAGQA